MQDPTPTLAIPDDEAEFERRFGTESLCRTWFFEARFPEGFRCPHARCNGSGSPQLSGRCQVVCHRCGAKTSLTAGTVFHRTKHLLRTWFRAAFLFRRWTSARQIGLTLKQSYKTAWLWCHKLRSVMQRAVIFPPRPDPRSLAAGPARADFLSDTQWDGVARLLWLRGPVGPPRARELERFPDVNLGEERRSCGHERLTAADWSTADRCDPESVGPASVTRSGPQEHVVAPEARLELLFAYRGAISEKHLQAYLDEFAFRRNRAQNDDPGGAVFEDILALSVSAPDLTYGDLVGSPPPRRPLRLVDSTGLMAGAFGSAL